jgi:hypothetical protein
LRESLERARGTTISAHTELVLALDLEEIGGLIEHGGYFGLLNGHLRACGSPAKGI